MVPKWSLDCPKVSKGKPAKPNLLRLVLKWVPEVVFGISLDSKGAGIFEWPGQTTEDVCAVSTIFIQFK